MKLWGVRALLAAGVLFALSIVIIVLNYLRGDDASNLFLYAGILLSLPVLPLAIAGLVLVVVGSATHSGST